MIFFMAFSKLLVIQERASGLCGRHRASMHGPGCTRPCAHRAAISAAPRHPTGQTGQLLHAAVLPAHHKLPISPFNGCVENRFGTPGEEAIMFALTDVFDGPRTMGLLQLLLAFVACMTYLLAQGHLLGAAGRRRAALAAVGSVAGFVAMDRDWASAIVLVAFAVAALGSFAAIVWLTTRAIGMDCAPSADTAAASVERRASAGDAVSTNRRSTSGVHNPPPTANDTAV
jgi:hypothetical protein